MCVEFRDEILFRGGGGGGECEIPENPNFQKRVKTVILIENGKFYRSRITK